MYQLFEIEVPIFRVLLRILCASFECFIDEFKNSSAQRVTCNLESHILSCHSVDSGFAFQVRLTQALRR